MFEAGTGTSSSFSPVSMAKVDGRIIASANNLKEVQVFFSEYPNGEVRVDRTENEIEGSVVRYSYEKVYGDGRVNELRMFVFIDEALRKPTDHIYVDCFASSLSGLGGITYSSLGVDITKALRTSDCAK